MIGRIGSIDWIPLPWMCFGIFSRTNAMSSGLPVNPLLIRFLSCDWAAEEGLGSVFGRGAFLRWIKSVDVGGFGSDGFDWVWERALDGADWLKVGGSPESG
jgi:hypothetical protein